MSKKTASLSVVIIAKNEEKNIEECLKTVVWADEVLLIDSGSIDKTIEIAKKYKSRVIKYLKGNNYSDWRNKGLSKAKSDWILYVDADEKITPDLRNEIIKVISEYAPNLKQKDSQTHSSYTEGEENAVAYAIPRRNIILGKELKHGGFWPDYQKRLFLKKALKGWKGELHEYPEFYNGFNKEVKKLENPMIHLKRETLSDMVEKTNRWSEIEAKLLYNDGHPKMNIPRFISAMFREFWIRMIKEKAFLDGKVGVVFALYQVFSRFVTYAKLWELQQK